MAVQKYIKITLECDCHNCREVYPGPTKQWFEGTDEMEVMERALNSGWYFISKGPFKFGQKWSGCLAPGHYEEQGENDNCEKTEVK